MSFLKNVALCLAVLLLLTACQKERTVKPLPLPEPPLVVKTEPGISGGQFSVTLNQGPRTFNPVLALDSASDAVVRFLFRSLVTFDLTTLEINPALAQSWSVSPDQKTWTFKLRRGLYWSDGARLTADDVVFTWNKVMYDPKYNQLTPGLFSVNGRHFEVTKVDELTVQVVTPEVYAPFLEFFGIVPILPRHATEAAANQGRFLETLGLNTPPERLPCSGPYRLKQLRPGDGLTLERNPAYYAVDKNGTRLPYFDLLHFNVVYPGTEIAALMAGHADLVEHTRPDYAAMLVELRTNPTVRVIELGVGSEREFLWFNQNTNQANGKPIVDPAKLAWFRNTAFRQAISCGINRDRMARDVYAGRARPVYGFVSDENPKWFNPNIPRYSYDPAKARALLEKAGLKDRNGDGLVEDEAGNTVKISFHCNTGNEYRAKAASFIVEDLRAIGIQFHLQLEEFPQLLQRINDTHAYECAFMGLGGGGIEPASQLNVLLSSAELHQWFPNQPKPSTGWEARVDQLTLQQMSIADFAARKKKFDEVQIILSEQLPMIYTVSPISYAGTRTNLGNIRPSAHTSYRLSWNLEELYWMK